MTLGTPLLLLLGAALGFGLAYWAYRRAVPKPPPAWRWTLTVFRGLTFTLLFFLLAEPLLTRNTSRELPADVLVLVDDSRSMQSALPDSTREAWLQRLAGLQAKSNARLLFAGFGEAYAPVDTLSTLPFAHLRTNLGLALERAPLDPRLRNLQAIVLLSDGQSNVGRTPEFVAERLNVPVNTVAIGDTLIPQDLEITRIAVNQILPVGLPAVVQSGYRARGASGQAARISLWFNGVMQRDTTIFLSREDEEGQLSLTFTPAGEGLGRVEMRISPLESESIRANNQRQTDVEVRNERLRVLLMGAGPGPELATLRVLLERDARVTLTTRVQQRAGAFYEGAFPESLETFDVLVLAGYPGAVADPALVRRIAQRAASGAGLVAFLTPQSAPNLWAGLRDVLPATPSGGTQLTTEVGAVRTPQGLAHPATRLPELDALSNPSLPPLSMPEYRWDVSPDARILLHPRVRGVEVARPLLSVRTQPGQRSALLAGWGYWRWTSLPAELQSADELFPAFVSALVRWTASPDARRVQATPDALLFDASERVRFSGTVRDESLQPVSDARFVLTLTDSVGVETQFTFIPESGGTYRAEPGTLPAGRYRYRAEAFRDDRSLGEDRGFFRVGALDVEALAPFVDASRLRAISASSGGAFWANDPASSLETWLQTHPALRPSLVTQREEKPIGHLWPFWVFIIGLLTAEWIGRKRVQLP